MNVRPFLREHGAVLCVYGSVCFALVLRFFSDIHRAAFSVGVALLLSLILETDRQQQRIFLFPVFCLAGVGWLYHLILHNQSPGSLLLGMVLGGGIFGLQYLISKGKLIGIGDVFLGIALGCVFGWIDLLFVLLLAYVGGSVLALIAILLKRIQPSDPLPLGAFLALAGIITLFLSSPWALFGIG